MTRMTDKNNRQTDGQTDKKDRRTKPNNNLVSALRNPKPDTQENKICHTTSGQNLTQDKDRKTK